LAPQKKKARKDHKERDLIQLLGIDHKETNFMNAQEKEDFKW